MKDATDQWLINQYAKQSARVKSASTPVLADAHRAGLEPIRQELEARGYQITAYGWRRSG